MKLYVNGDSHAAAAEAVTPHAFAEDDPRYNYLGRAPHPDNWAVGWPRGLADLVKAVLHTDAESASSNQRILRTTREWARANQAWARETLILVQWSTWEREEWWIDDRPYQVTASGTDCLPPGHEKRYKRWIADLDWQQCTQHWHSQIWDLHLELNELGFQHVFWNGNSDFAKIPPRQRHEWGKSYLDPYDPDGTQTAWLKHNGYHTIAPDSWHFGRDAHAAWAHLMLQYVINNNLMV